MGDKGEVDMGVFAPTEMLDVGQAEDIIREFIEFWQA